MDNVRELIKYRSSIRSYVKRSMDGEIKKGLIEFLKSNVKGPYGNKVRFELVDLDEMKPEDANSLGTYGFIKGATHFIVGVAKKRRRAMEDFGYCMEKNILHATGLGLGTCWLGGTFRRSNFAKKLNIKENELLPAITPVGYPAKKRSFRDSLIRFSAGSKKRKKWGKLFFRTNFEKPLSQDEAGEYRAVLESVRLGPSASNRQPWRIVREVGKFHFFCSSTRGYHKLIKGIRLQNIDMGIAMAHFELSAIELGLSGKWVEIKPKFDFSGKEYIVSWAESN